MSGYGWNEPVKTIMLHPEHGKIRTELPAIDILREPNRHQFESIIKAMSVCVFELIRLEQERSERMMGLIQRGTGENDETVQSAVRERNSGSDQGRSGDLRKQSRRGSPEV